MMLRVQTQELDGTLICSTLEGRFTGEGAEDVRLLIVTRCDSKLELVMISRT